MDTQNQPVELDTLMAFNSFLLVLLYTIYPMIAWFTKIKNSLRHIILLNRILVTFFFPPENKIKRKRTSVVSRHSTIWSPFPMFSQRPHCLVQGFPVAKGPATSAEATVTALWVKGPAQDATSQSWPALAKSTRSLGPQVWASLRLDHLKGCKYINDPLY